MTALGIEFGPELGALAADVGQVHAMLRELSATVAVAESLTGGLLSAVLTMTPGASQTMRGGLVVYATDLKTSLAAVPESLLADRGPVDADVAMSLAIGARVRLGATFGVGVTGVAGPDPQDGAEVGTVFLAVATPVEQTVAERAFPGERAAIRVATVREAVALLAKECSSTLASLRSL